MTKNYPNIRFILSHAGGTVSYTAGRFSILSSLFEGLGGVGSYIAEGADMVSHLITKLKEDFTDDLVLYLKFKNNMLEGPVVYLKRFYYDNALSASPYTFASLQTLVDSSQIVFGSDYVFATEAAVPLTIKGITEHKGFNENGHIINQKRKRQKPISKAKND